MLLKTHTRRKMDTTPLLGENSILRPRILLLSSYSTIIMDNIPWICHCGDERGVRKHYHTNIHFYLMPNRAWRRYWCLHHGVNEGVCIKWGGGTEPKDEHCHGWSIFRPCYELSMLEWWCREMGTYFTSVGSEMVTFITLSISHVLSLKDTSTMRGQSKRWSTLVIRITLCMKDELS